MHCLCVLLERTTECRNSLTKEKNRERTKQITAAKRRREKREKTFNDPPQGDMLVGRRGRGGRKNRRTEKEEKGGK